MSWPSISTEPPETSKCAGRIPRTARQVRVLPLPDSPTMPTALPGVSAKLDAVDDLAVA